MKGEISQAEKLKVIQERCKTDLKFLCTEVLGMTRWQPGFHDDLAKYLQMPGDRKLILEPRGHQKTSFGSVAFGIQEKLKNPNQTQLIVSAIWELSRTILRQISGYLSDGLLPEIFGNFRTPQTYWTQDALTISQRTNKVSKDPTFNTAGIETGKTGYHYDFILLDDIVSPENVTTKEQINKVKEAIKDLMPLLNPGGKLVMIGTRYALSDAYGYIIENEMRSINGYFFKDAEERKQWRNFVNATEEQKKGREPVHTLGRWDVFLRKAIEDGKPVFPLAYVLTDEELALKKKENPSCALESLETVKRENQQKWFGQYLNDPIDQESVEFKNTWFRTYEITDDLSRKLQTANYVLSIDPAFRLKQHNDFSGLTVTATTSDNFVYVVEAKQLKVNPDKLLEEIFRLIKIYKPSKVVVETAQAQLLLAKLIKDKMRELNEWFFLEEVSPGSDDNKAARIRGLIPHYANGRIFHAPGLQDLEAQLTEFPRNSHDDIIDSLAYQIPFWKAGDKEAKKPETKVEGDWDWWKKKALRKPLVLGSLFNDLRRR